MLHTVDILGEAFEGVKYVLFEIGVMIGKLGLLGGFPLGYAVTEMSLGNERAIKNLHVE